MEKNPIITSSAWSNLNVYISWTAQRRKSEEFEREIIRKQCEAIPIARAARAARTYYRLQFDRSRLHAELADVIIAPGLLLLSVCRYGGNESARGRRAELAELGVELRETLRTSKSIRACLRELH